MRGIRLNQGKEVKEDAKMRAFMRDIQEIISEIIHQYHPSNPDLASNDMSVELEIESINSIKIKINRNGKIPPTDSRKSERTERKEG